MHSTLMLFINFCILAAVTAQTPVFRLDLTDPDSGYHGLVKENETTVDLRPTLKAVGKTICSFKVTNKHHGEVPFEVFVADPQTGVGEIRAKRELNCEKRKNYKFDVAAVSCDGVESPSVTVHVTIEDINEYQPTFIQPSYEVQVDEGRIYDEIVRIEAEDEDCTPKYGDICRYEILNTDAPFHIAADGVLKNTDTLHYDVSHSYVLSVVAYDCGMYRSEPVMVTVRVNKICHLGWKGVPERVDYIPGSGEQELFPVASLELCDVPCTVNNIEMSVQLTTGHIGKGCDRDTYAVENQRKLCGASDKAVDLLPEPTSTSWTNGLTTDNGHESDRIFEFNGMTGATIPSSVLDTSMPSTFTLSTWMKHGTDGASDKHRKEHIFCTADDHKMNRHHTALFVRNCRLILLLRREYQGDDSNTFRPAEWRWKIPEVCDDEWHHYAVSVDGTDVSLYIDGSKFDSTKVNPEIIDDWPLHKADGITVKTMVGACWQSTEQRTKHELKGFLAGLSFLPGQVETEDVISCLPRCRESLKSPPPGTLEPGMEVLANNELTQVTLLGANRTNLEKLVRSVGYINSREFPTTGHRPLKVVTSVSCDNGKSVKIPSLASYVNVLPATPPTIHIDGAPNQPYQAADLNLGVRVFVGLRISITTNDEEVQLYRNGEVLSNTERRLDACHVTVSPSLNPTHEQLGIPESVLSTIDVSALMTDTGVVLQGSEVIYNYEQLLRQIHYTNKEPAYYLSRTFRLVCTIMNGRYNSNEFVQTLTIIHPEPTEKPKTVPIHQYAHAEFNKHHANLPSNIYLAESYGQTAHSVGTSNAVTIIIVVCIGFMAFMVVLGVVRIRAAQRRSSSRHEALHDNDLAWDDSSLTITVNPMETVTKVDETSACLNASESEDDYSSSDDEAQVRNRGDLEWDNNM